MYVNVETWEAPGTGKFEIGDVRDYEEFKKTLDYLIKCGIIGSTQKVEMKPNKVSSEVYDVCISNKNHEDDLEYIPKIEIPVKTTNKKCTWSEYSELYYNSDSVALIYKAPIDLLEDIKSTVPDFFKPLRYGYFDSFGEKCTKGNAATFSIYEDF